MDTADRSARTEDAVRLARGAIRWLVDGDAADPEDPLLYHGRAGVVSALQEASEYFGSERYGRAAAVGAGRA